ncbi:hypothetical protein ABZP36_012539 [Zizania latifolia]
MPSLRKEAPSSTALTRAAGRRPTTASAEGRRSRSSSTASACAVARRRLPRRIHGYSTPQRPATLASFASPSARLHEPPSARHPSAQRRRVAPMPSRSTAYMLCSRE